jgi:hypothetical protein
VIPLDSMKPSMVVLMLSAAVAAGHIVIGLGAHALFHRVIMHRHAVIPHVFQPIDDVSSAVEASSARRSAEAEVDFAAGEMQILGDLRAGLARPDHQHFAFWQHRGILVFARAELRHARWQSLGHTRNGRNVIAADGNDHLVGRACSGRGVDFELAAWADAHGLHRDTLDDRWVE